MSQNESFFPHIDIDLRNCITETRDELKQILTFFFQSPSYLEKDI